MKKIFFFAILTLSMLSGCSIEKNIPQDQISPTENAAADIVQTTEQDAPGKSAAIQTEAPINVIGQNPQNVVDSIGKSSYKELENLSEEKKSKVMSYNMEHCYFKMKNIPEDYEEIYVSIWEIGFFAEYKNPKTEETLKLHWWANDAPKKYLKELKADEDNVVIEKNGIDYYCEFWAVKREPTDTSGPVAEPYRVDIRWVEDDKCFYINIHSDTPLDESVIDLCELEKIPIK